MIRSKKRVIGDVSLWHLPWIEYWIRKINSEKTETGSVADAVKIKVLVLKRNRNDTINSFDSWFARFGHFPWMSKADQEKTCFESKEVGVGFSEIQQYELYRGSNNKKSDIHRKCVYTNDDQYDQCYPKYKFLKTVPSIKEGAARYYDDYYQHCDFLLEKYPEVVKLVDSYEILNNEQVQRNVLKWIGFDENALNLTNTMTEKHQTNRELMLEVAKDYVSKKS